MRLIGVAAPDVLHGRILVQQQHGAVCAGAAPPLQPQGLLEQGLHARPVLSLEQICSHQ